jgi:pimeloyl-ACP methyl ester carboxylesterase
MDRQKPTLVLFPGAWGNRNHLIARWWFRHVITFFSDHPIVVVTYTGESLEEMCNAALQDLRLLPNGSIAIAYSMGAQVLRGVANQRPELFKRVAFIAGLERFGVRFQVLLSALTFALLPILRTLLGRPLRLDSELQLRRVFLGGTRDKDAHELGKEIFEGHIHPESGWASIQLFLPPLRVRMPAITCPVMAIIPDQDFILPSANYPGEQVQKVAVIGDHSLLCGSEIRLRPALLRLRAWLELPSS